MISRSQRLTSLLMAGSILLLSGPSCKAPRSSNSNKVSEGRSARESSKTSADKGEHEDQEQIPDWAKMMEDPHVNYFKAIEAYEAWLKEEEEQENKKEGNVSKEGDEEDQGEYAWEKKKFNAWKRDVAPFVRPDGSIPTAEQRLEIIKNSQR